MKRSLLFLFLTGCFAPFTVEAQAVSTLLPVSVRVVPVASLTATPLDFGSFTREIETVYGQAMIAVSLPSGVPYNITLDGGMHYTAAWRNIEKSGFLIKYDLFQESGYEWGDGDFDGTYSRGLSQAGIGTGAPQLYTVRGQLYVSSMDVNAPPGRYQDMVRVTVYY